MMTANRRTLNTALCLGVLIFSFGAAASARAASLLPAPIRAAARIPPGVTGLVALAPRPGHAVGAQTVTVAGGWSLIAIPTNPTTPYTPQSLSAEINAQNCP